MARVHSPKAEFFLESATEVSLLRLAQRGKAPLSGGWPPRGGEAHLGREQPRSCTDAQRLAAGWAWAQLERREGDGISAMANRLVASSPRLRWFSRPRENGPGAKCVVISSLY